jgi:hypothetical protein
MLRLALLAAAFALAAQAAVAAPIALKMQPGTDSVTVHGVLSRTTDCCTYTFKAEAGQQLYVTESGAVARLVITYPDGNGEGPGFDSPLTLPATGAYTLSVSGDQMAEHAFGPFTLTVRIPPKR